jgi:hypothetical protein
VEPNSALSTLLGWIQILSALILLVQALFSLSSTPGEATRQKLRVLHAKIRPWLPQQARRKSNPPRTM